MPAITLDKAREILDGWLAAEAAVQTGQEYYIGGQRMRRADLDMIGQRVSYWVRQVERLEKNRSGPRIQYVVPV